MVFYSHSPMDKQNEHRITACEVYCSVVEITHLIHMTSCQPAFLSDRLRMID